MSWHSYSRADLTAIAVGGILGALLREPLAARDVADSVLVWDPPELANAGITTPLLEGGNLLIPVYGFPYGTIIANLLGCLVLGILTALSRQAVTVPSRRLALAASIGFCGSLTTFSTFAVDLARLLRGEPVLADLYPDEAQHFDPALGNAVLYLALSLIGGALVFWLGRSLGREITTRNGISPGEGTQ